MSHMVKFYHYSDEDGMKGILKSRKIRQSPNGRQGRGVYFTRFSPKHGRAKIAQENWTNWRDAENSGKVDYTISVLLPRYRVKRYGDIYVFRKDVFIDETKYKLYSVDDDHWQLEPGFSS
ncbi:hypothetical protein ACOMHN_056318 [Nucella lapillus]